MPDREAAVDWSVEQVNDGTHYKGHLEIAGNKLYYELVFKIPIVELRSVQIENIGATELKGLFRLIIRRNEDWISLTDPEYAFFLGLILDPVVNYHNNPQTRDFNSRIGQLLCGGSRLSDFGASASILVIGRAVYEFPTEICVLLSQPKFGCQFV